MKPKTIIIRSPLKGVAEQASPDAIPQDMTPSALNVVPFDRSDKARCSLRPGLENITESFETYYTAFTPGVAIDLDATVYRMGPIGDGTVYGVFEGPSITGATSIGTTIGDALPRTICFSISQPNITSGPTIVVAGEAYTTVITSNGSTWDTGVNLTGLETAGTAPTATPLCCMWNNRLVLASFEGQFYMSRIGDLADWDYTAADTGRAIAGIPGANSIAGGFTGKLRALIPFNDDILLLCGENSIFRVTGDPGYGASIMTISTEVGVVGPQAWCRDPSGIVWFISPNGLYRYAGGNIEPAPTADRVNTRFTRYTKGSSPWEFNLAYDRVRHGLWVFLSNDAGATDDSDILFYDMRTGGFWPMAMMDDDTVTGAYAYEGPSPSDRQVVITFKTHGSKLLSNDVVVDSIPPGDNPDYPIDSYLWIGPFAPFGPNRRGKLISARVRLGDQYGSIPFRLNYSIQCADDALDAKDNPDTALTGYWDDPGTQQRFSPRLCATHFAIKLYGQGSYDWSFDRIELVFDDGGEFR